LPSARSRARGCGSYSFHLGCEKSAELGPVHSRMSSAGDRGSRKRQQGFEQSRLAGSFGPTRRRRARPTILETTRSHVQQLFVPAATSRPCIESRSGPAAEGGGVRRKSRGRGRFGSSRVRAEIAARLRPLALEEADPADLGQLRLRLLRLLFCSGTARRSDSRQSSMSTPDGRSASVFLRRRKPGFSDPPGVDRGRERDRAAAAELEARHSDRFEET